MFRVRGRAAHRILVGFLVSCLSIQSFCAEPGDSATEWYNLAQKSIFEGQQGKAISRLRAILREYPTSPYAVQAQMQIAELYARNREYASAFDACQQVIARFPSSQLFDKALQTQFDLADRVIQEYRQLKLKKEKGTKGLPDRESASEMLRIILANGRFTAYAPRAQYRLAASLDEEDKSGEAVKEFYKFIEDYSDHPLVDDAAFQIAFIDYRRSRQTNHERGAQERALLAFEYFLIKYPESEKAPEARHLVGVLQKWEADRFREAGRYYERTGQSDAALRTYREALRLDSASAAARPAGNVSKSPANETTAPSVPIRN